MVDHGSLTISETFRESQQEVLSRRPGTALLTTPD